MNLERPGHAVAADADLATAILQDAAERLRQLMPSLDVARVVAVFGIMGLVKLGGYEEVLTIVPAAVARAVDGQRGEVSDNG